MAVSELLRSGGMAIRVACGSWISRRIANRRMPRLRAAAIWPAGTDRMALRTISATKAPT